MKTAEELALEATHWTRLGYIHRAVACQLQRVNLTGQRGDRVNEAVALGELASEIDALGNADEAIEAGERSLALAREIGDRQMENRVCTLPAKPAIGSMSWPRFSAWDMRISGWVNEKRRCSCINRAST